MSAPPAAAAVSVFTDESAFQAALSGGGTVTTVDFEAVPAGTVISSSDAVAGVSFLHSIAGGSIDLAVGDGLPTTSGGHYLGLDQPDVQDTQIQHGDEIDLVLPPSRAFALTLVSGDPLLAGDVLLETPEGVAGNAEAPAGTTADGGHVYFLGLVAEAPFETVNVRYGDPNAVAFLYTIDDLAHAELAPAAALAIPAQTPATAALLALALAAAAFLVLRRG